MNGSKMTDITNQSIEIMNQKKLKINGNGTINNSNKTINVNMNGNKHSNVI